MCHEDDHNHDVETEQNSVFENLVPIQENTCDKHEADISIVRPAERQSDEPTWPILLNVGETEPEQVDRHEQVSTTSIP